MKTNFNSFKSSEELVDSFCKTIIEKLKNAIKTKEKAVLLVSGGNTPKVLFEKLCRCDIAWEKVIVSLVDERWVNKRDEDSNEKLVKEYLLKDKASKASFLSLYQDGVEAQDCVEFCSNLVKKELFPCDVLILGMGDDSHTASLFPNNEKLEEGINLKNESYCVSMTPLTAKHARMSLTLSAILKADNIYLHIQGIGKKEVYEKALKEDNFLLSPISAVLKNENKQIEVYYNE